MGVKSTALAMAATAALAVACGGERSGAHPGHGIVREVHPDRSEVVIQHEEIPDLMDAMTMGFRVEDPGMLGGIEPGEEVDFSVKYENGEYTITELRPSGD
jgi:Cu/Ag efflux protein CusF